MKLVSRIGFHTDVFKPSLLKSTAVFLVFMFAWTNLGIYQVVYAAENSKDLKGSSSLPLKVRGTEGSYDFPQGEVSRGLESLVTRIRERAEKIESKIPLSPPLVKGEGVPMGGMGRRFFDIESEKAGFQKEKSERVQSDINIRAQLKQTEARIKDLPSVIQQRQKEFDVKYEKNFKQLKAELDAINTAKTNYRFTTRKPKTFLNCIVPVEN